MNKNIGFLYLMLLSASALNGMEKSSAKKHCFLNWLGKHEEGVGFTMAAVGAGLGFSSAIRVVKSKLFVIPGSVLGFLTGAYVGAIGSAKVQSACHRVLKEEAKKRDVEFKAKVDAGRRRMCLALAFSKWKWLKNTQCSSWFSPLAWKHWCSGCSECDRAEALTDYTQMTPKEQLATVHELLQAFPGYSDPSSYLGRDFAKYIAEFGKQQVEAMQGGK